MVKGSKKQDMTTVDITKELQDMGYSPAQKIVAKKILHDLKGTDGYVCSVGACLFDWELKKPYLIKGNNNLVYEIPAMDSKDLSSLSIDQQWKSLTGQNKYIIPFSFFNIANPEKKKTRGRPKKNPTKEQQVVDIKTIDVTIEKKSISKSLYEQLSPQDRLDAIADRPFTRWETACMLLGIPQSGLKWLDDLIMISPRS